MNGYLHRSSKNPGVGGYPGGSLNPRIAVTIDAPDMAEIVKLARARGCSTAVIIRGLIKVGMSELVP